MKPIVRVHNVGKLYRIGSAETASDLRETIYHAFRAPFRRYKRNVNSNGDAATTLWALKDISFEVQPGEIFGIIGRNGAGKSTLLKILSRVTQPTTGHIELYGRMGSLLEVGTGFHPELTGRENVFLNGAILGMARAEIYRKFDEIVAFAEIERFLDTPVKHYSSGMYMRLAFAVAAFLEPEILVVDEVLAVGDVEFQQKCLGKMGDLRRHGRTVLIVSHNMASIMNLCQRALLLNNGKIVAEGRPADVIQTYLASAHSVGGEAVWTSDEAPGNDLVRLLAVRVCQEEQAPTADVDISKDIIVQITYENLIEGTRLYSALWLKDAVGTFVLSSANLHSMNLTTDPWYGEPYPRGTFTSICRIPGDFLNEGSYNITAIVGKVPSQTQILEEAVVSFQVHDTGGMRKEYLGNWAGPVIRPRLAWNTSYIDA